MNQIIERQTAYITSIAILLTGIFIKPETQMQPSYIQTQTGKHLSRVHLIGVVVGLSETGNNEIIIDDGTGKIRVRSFQLPDFFAGVQLGDIIRLIGKVRSFNEQVYLIPEIMKKVTNKGFIFLHKLLLQKEGMIIMHTALPEEVGGQHEEVIEEIPVNADDSVPASPFEKVINCIRRLDTGEGVAIEQILQEEGRESEKLLQHLLEMGEIFEIRPGRVKLLE